MEPLDEFDRRLLALLEIDARLTGAELSERVGLSPSSCLRRVQRLRDIGAIRREVAVIAPEFSDRRVTVLALLEVTRNQADRIDRLKAEFTALPQVERFYHVTGDADFVLTVSCASMEDYAAFTEAHFYSPLISRFESLVVLREYEKPLPTP